MAGIAAVISYKHMFVLVQRYGETSWTAALLPVSVDGMIVASSMSLLADSRAGRRSSLLPWVLLVIGSAASLAANVAVAEPSVVGRVIAAWPSCALIGAYELLMRQVRQGSRRESAVVGESTYEAAKNEPDASDAAPDAAPAGPSTRLVGVGASYETLASRAGWSNGSDGARTKGAEILLRGTGRGRVQEACEDEPRAHPQAGGPVSVLQREAWQWALAHRTPAGDLPSGKVIAERFGRRERWGRLVKQAGVAGRLNPPAAR